MSFARTLLPALALSLIGVAAHAADLPPRGGPPPAIAPEPVYAPVWSGFYVTGNVGGAFEDKSGLRLTDVDGNAFTLPVTGRDASSVTFGGGVGYNVQVGSFVGGLEADYNYVNLRSRNGLSYSEPLVFGFTGVVDGQARKTIDSFGTARGRIGYLVTPQIFAYGTGGLAFGDTAFSGSVSGRIVDPTGATFASAGPYGAKRSQFQVGYTAGGGVEYALNPQISVKAEALYVNLDGQSIRITDETLGGVTLRTRERDFVVGRLGVNYKW